MNLLDSVRQSWLWRLRSRHLRSFADALRRQELDRPFVIIAMPGSLHVAALALAKVPQTISRMIVLNGMSDWEVKLARKMFPGVAMVPCRCTMEHDQVLDILFENLNTDFGILDYDCFVLDPVHFEPMRSLGPSVLMNACFSRRHPTSGLRVPETFFLFFNCRAIQALKQRYKVSCTPVKWPDIDGKAREALNAAGLPEGAYPEAHKTYFDTLRVLMMLGVADGMKVEFLADFPATPTPSGEIFHVGGISNPTKVDGLWRFRGVYFWRRVLESCHFPELKARYEIVYGRQSSADLKLAYPVWASEVSDEFFEFCDKIVFGAAGA